MKKSLLHIIFSLLLATGFLLSGTGYNMVQYCCDDCFNAGIEHVSKTACESIHDHARDSYRVKANSGICVRSSQKNCQFSRLEVDVPLIDKNSFSFTLFSQIFYIEIFSSIIDTENFNKIILISGINHSPFPNFILPNGRKILSHKSVLII
ncbi:MAG: hypothetical protein ACK5L7_03635 [Paludibacteraceae bacterium]